MPAAIDKAISDGPIAPMASPAGPSIRASTSLSNPSAANRSSRAAWLLRAIRSLGVTILPVVPTSAAKLLDLLGVTDRSHTALADRDGWYDTLMAQDFRIVPPTPIFPRREVIEEEEPAGCD